MENKYNYKIGIIVPVYNAEKYLKKCIDSILNQTHMNFELLLVDDGSTDNSLSIMKNYENKDQRVKVFHKQNGGQGSARNLALNYATGDFIGFVDSDDYIKDDMYEQLLKCSIDYDADISVCGVINDHLILKKEFKYFNGVKVFSTSNEILDAYFKYPYLGDSSCNKLYKAELWENIRFPEIKSREDIAILYKIYFSCNKIVRIGDCKYIQYIRPGSTEQKAFTEDKLVSIDIAKNQAKYIKDNYPEYYKNVEDIVLRRYVGCLEEIVGGGYLKNKKVFDKVLKNYMDEIEYYNFNADKKYINPVEHRIIFILKVKISYIKMKIINNIKKVYFILYKDFQ